MVASIPANDLSACVNQALEALGRLYPNAEFPSADWVLGARAQELGIAPKDQQSANGSCRLLACRDGWLGVNLARNTDRELLGAWLATDAEVTTWSALAAALAHRSGRKLLVRGREMGLPLGFAQKPARAPDEKAASLQFLQLLHADSAPAQPRSLHNAKVVDLSALWAGPLCAHLLHRCGAQVTTVSSSQRPDGAAHGSPSLYQHLHSGHKHRVLNFNDPDQLAALANMLTEADVVIEASRPRALQGLGLDRETLTVIKPQIWLSLTAYGRDDPNGQWVGFGDDVAVSANLLQWTAEGRPEFLGDAVADPLTGTLAALAVAHAVSVGQSGLLDLSMAAVASQCRRKVLSSERALFCPLRKVSHAD
jgi:hypothetical protein